MKSKRLIALATSAVLLCTQAPGFAADTPVNTNRVITNLEFDSMTTNAMPFGLTVSKAGAFIRQYDEKVENKVLEVNEPAAKSSVEVGLRETSDSMVFSFDYMQYDTMIARTVSLTDSASNTSQIFNVATDGKVTLSDGRTAFVLQPEKWYNIAVVCRMSEKRYDFYIDGKCVASKILMNNYSKFGIAKILKFSAGSGGIGSKYCLDNIRICKGTALPKESEFVHETFSPKWTEPVEMVYTSDESTVFFNHDFNQDKVDSKPSGISLNMKNASNTFVISDGLDKENYVMKATKGASDAADPFGDIAVNGFGALSAVLEFKFHPLDGESIRVVTFRDDNGKFNEVFRALSGGELRVFGKKTGTYEVGKTYHIAVVIDYENQWGDAYIDGVLVGEKLKFSNTSADIPATVRFQIPSSSAAGSTYYDDIRFYAGSKIKPDEEFANVSTASEAEFIVTPEEDVIKTLENSVAVQLFGNKAYSGGEKVTVAQGGELIDNIPYVPVRFISGGFGAEVSWSDANQSVTVKNGSDTYVYTIGSAQVSVNGETKAMKAPAVIYGSSAMLPAVEFENLIPGAQVSTNEQYGVALIDAGGKNITVKQLKDIYNYITYSRPSASAILSDFEPMKNVHPRIMATDATFETIKKNIQTDENMKKWYNSVLSSAEVIIKAKHTYYYIPDGLRLLDMSRQLLSRARTLGMAYQLTKEQKYLDYLWGEMDAVCNFADWNSEAHFLDTAEMTAGVVIAYDWCYHYWTPEQRNVMEDAIMNLGLKEGRRCLDFQMPTGTQWVKIENNWNQVCAGGMTLGALALMDIYPEYCADIAERCLLALESSLADYAPDGAWYEGPDYWAYAIRYLVYHMASLNSVLGTDYGYLDGSYMKTTTDYITYTQSALGAFNIGDAGNIVINEPTAFYLAKKFDIPELTLKRLQDMKMYSKGGSATDLLFYTPEHVTGEEVKLELDAKFREVEIATFRSAWDDTNAMFAGIHGGYNNAIHGNLDAGTFVLDASGERWAVELGSDNYNQGGYFTLADGYRYKLYRCSTQGQNVLAMNPASELGQEQFGTAKIVDYVFKPRGGYTVLDMTSIYGNKVNSAKRGLKLDANRTQTIVQDEVDLTYITDLMWFMHTKADIEISENGKYAILTQNGKKLFVGLDCSIKSARFEASSATPIPNSLVKPSSYSNASYKRLNISIPGATGNVTLAVRFIPISGNMMLSELIENGIGKTVPIDRWHIEDGEIDVPVLSDIIINGKSHEGFDKSKTSYSIEFEFGNDATPVVEAKADSKYAYDIVQPENANGVGEIKVYEKDNEKNATYYSLSFRVLPLMGRPEGYEKHDIQNIEVSSEPQAANPKSHAIDGNLESRWSADGYNEWMKVDLGSVKDVNVVTLAFYSGASRVTYFNIQVSADGNNWTTVHSGESSGVTDGYESVFVGEHKARYVKINTFGNSVNSWNSYSEIEVFGNSGK